MIPSFLSGFLILNVWKHATFRSAAFTGNWILGDPVLQDEIDSSDVHVLMYLEMFS